MIIHHIINLILFIGFIVFITYSSKYEKIRKQKIDRTTKSFQDEDQKRWLEFLAARKNSSIMGMIVGTMLGIFLTIYMFADFGKLPVYIICIMLTIIVLFLEILIIIIRFRLKKNNKFMNINLDHLYKNNKKYNYLQCLFFLLFDIILISSCYSIYFIYK